MAAREIDSDSISRALGVVDTSSIIRSRREPEEGRRAVGQFGHVTRSRTI